ncbi:hypothetical protein Hamer_G022454 [Homarus americanus]|uniref:Uncharacterized protein n=1 Tax=Homarus americanus TaxID=6706 RepID=A0A8J5TIK4_HOMAM|nr:hypothetical protein Hamer_G022454 [Homarus americanus]
MPWSSFGRERPVEEQERLVEHEEGETQLLSFLGGGWGGGVGRGGGGARARRSLTQLTRRGNRTRDTRLTERDL